MRPMLVAFSAVILAAFPVPSQADYKDYCRLPNSNSDPIFRQNCKAETFARLAIIEPVVVDKPDQPNHEYDKCKHDLKKKLAWLYHLKQKLYAIKHKDCNSGSCESTKKIAIAKLNYLIAKTIAEKKYLVVKLHKLERYHSPTTYSSKQGSTLGSASGSLGGTAERAMSANSTVGSLSGSVSKTSGGLLGGLGIK